MTLEVKVEDDPDFPNRKAYRIDCPKCHKFFLGSTERQVRNMFFNHRMIHNGESEA